VAVEPFTKVRLSVYQYWELPQLMVLFSGCDAHATLAVSRLPLSILDTNKTPLRLGGYPKFKSFRDDFIASVLRRWWCIIFKIDIFCQLS
jgi:hypothetical protein